MDTGSMNAAPLPYEGYSGPVAWYGEDVYGDGVAAVGGAWMTAKVEPNGEWGGGLGMELEMAGRDWYQ